MQDERSVIATIVCMHLRRTSEEVHDDEKTFRLVRHVQVLYIRYLLRAGIRRMRCSTSIYINPPSGNCQDREQEPFSI